MTTRSLDRLLLDGQEFAWLTGLAFRGLSVSESPEGWNCVIRAWGKGRRPLYAIATGESPHDSLRALLVALAKKNGSNLWRYDRYFGRTP